MENRGCFRPPYIAQHAISPLDLIHALIDIVDRGGTWRLSTVAAIGQPRLEDDQHGLNIKDN